MRSFFRTSSALLLLIAAPLSTAIAQGSWTATARTEQLMQFNLHWESSQWGRTLSVGELRGLSERDITSSTSAPVTFRIERDAGVFEMEGVFRDGRGAGHFHFEPNPRFRDALRSQGVTDADQLTDREQMTLAFTGFSLASLSEFRELGFRDLRKRELIELAVHEVTPAYVRSLRSIPSVGSAGTNTVAAVVEMKIHRITPEFVRSLQSAGYGDLSRRQLLAMGIHGVTPEYIRELRAAGMTNLDARDLTDMRIHRVTPEFIREMREVGLGDLSARNLIELRIHRVTARYVRELAELGYTNLSRRELLDMSIHNVTPAYIRELREAGLRDLSARTLIRMKIHGIDREVVRARERPR